jgi:hypothetical protein
MAFTLSGADESALVFLALIVLIIGRRVAMMVRGAPVRTERILATAVLFSALFVLVLAESYFQVPWWTYAIDAAVLAVTIVLTIGYVRRHVVFEQRDGAWYYRLHPVIVVAYLVLFVVRLALDLVVLGINPFAPPTSGPALAGTTLVLVAVVDALFSLSTGLLIGRSVGVVLEYRAKTAAGTLPTPPPPPPPAASPLP